MSLPGRANSQAVGSGSIEAERIWPKPPSRCASPSSTSIPEGSQGVVQGPTLTRAAPASK